MLNQEHTLQNGDVITNPYRHERYVVVKTGFSGYISSSESYGDDLVRVLDLDNHLTYDLPRSHFGLPWEVTGKIERY